MPLHAGDISNIAVSVKIEGTGKYEAVVMSVTTNDPNGCRIIENSGIDSKGNALLKIQALRPGTYLMTFNFKLGEVETVAFLNVVVFTVIEGGLEFNADSYAVVTLIKLPKSSLTSNRDIYFLDKLFVKRE